MACAIRFLLRGFNARLNRSNQPPSRERPVIAWKKEDEMEAFIVLLVLLLSFSFALIIFAAKGNRTRQREENRRAARRYDML
jgi:hypothetical protein